MHRLLPLLLILSACGPDSTNQKPSGSTADPVEVCERVADVCRIDGSRLGVCMQDASGEGFTCESQH